MYMVPEQAPQVRVLPAFVPDARRTAGPRRRRTTCLATRMDTYTYDIHTNSHHHHHLTTYILHHDKTARLAQWLGNWLLCYVSICVIHNFCGSEWLVYSTADVSWRV
ncbi:unnamed protein product [Spodoptera exigua]|nr:unnamed protein product [Spodoptera exigua]